MKRSEINRIMRRADAFIRSNGFHLPPFAFWSVEEWQNKGPEVQEITNNSLGWDITDFGSGHFEETGLFLFTVRNGHPSNLKEMSGKLYAEKIMMAEVGQVTPMHFHWNKMEDIINRGGGDLVIELYNATPDESLADTDVVVSIDGCEKRFKAGSRVSLKPGESISLTPYLYHSFWAESAPVLIGEVSLVNDDSKDNRFLEPVGRFPTIEEDEAPLYLLVGDYTEYYGFA
ncbi:MAG: D-lyxose/D-mannose family sugar isomerase [Anaerolineaceae bacterium]|nr:D-lyxose/D-mannose family sugar isomerase [Anaerolineaceae bacterium]